MKQVKCKSGLKGWQSNLQKVYSSFEEFVSYCETYKIHKRLGFKSVEKCWNKNLLIRGSLIPTDLEVVKKYYFNLKTRNHKNNHVSKNQINLKKIQ